MEGYSSWIRQVYIVALHDRWRKGVTRTEYPSESNILEFFSLPVLRTVNRIWQVSQLGHQCLACGTSWNPSQMLNCRQIVCYIVQWTYCHGDPGLFYDNQILLFIKGTSLLQDTKSWINSCNCSTRNKRNLLYIKLQLSPPKCGQGCYLLSCASWSLVRGLQWRLSLYRSQAELSAELWIFNKELGFLWVKPVRFSFLLKDLWMSLVCINYTDKLMLSL